MNKMYVYVSALCLSLCLLGACSSDDDNGGIIPGKNEVVLDKGTSTNQTVFADETAKNEGIKFTTVGPWKAEVRAVATRAEDSQVDWLTLSQYEGDKAGEYTLTITLKQNFTGQNRKAEIRIVCGDTVITIIVEQKADKQDGAKLLRVQSIRRSVVYGAAFREVYGQSGLEEDGEQYAMHFTYDDQGRVLQVVEDNYLSNNSVEKDTYTFRYGDGKEVEVKLKEEAIRPGSEPYVDGVTYRLFMNEQGYPTRIHEIEETDTEVFHLTYTDDHRLQKISVNGDENRFGYQDGLLVSWQKWENEFELDSYEVPADVLYPHRYSVNTVNLNLNGLFVLTDDHFMDMFFLMGLMGNLSDCLMEAVPMDELDDESYCYFDKPNQVITKTYQRIKLKETPYDVVPLVYSFDSNQTLQQISVGQEYEYGIYSYEIHVGNQLINEENPNQGYQFEIKNEKWTKKGDEKNVITLSLEYEK